MASRAETAESIRAVLEPYVRPREEAARIRRVLAAHLASCLKSDDALEGSLALVDVPWDLAPSPEVRGLQRAYLRALQANLDARRTFAKTSQEATKQLQQWQKQSQESNQTQQTPQAVSGGPACQRRGASVLEDHLEAVRLAQKKKRLEAVQRGLDALVQQPAAAAEDFLQQDAIYAEATRTLPPVPKAVVDGLAEEAAAEAAAEAGKSGSGSGGGGGAVGGQQSKAATAAAAADLKELVAQLDKAVLRAQLLLRREEKQLAAARQRAAGGQKLNGSGRSGIARGGGAEAEGVRLQALGAARDELIGWMEGELGSAAATGEAEDGIDDDDDGEGEESARQLRQSLLGGDGGEGGGRQRRQRVDEAVAAIRDKYARYVEARRQLVQMVGSKAPSASAAAIPALPLFANMPKLQPWGATGQANATTATTAAETARVANSSTTQTALGHVLLTPYLERLLACARQQKALIAHKTHHHAVLARRLRDTCQTLDHMADESQLLPRHPLPGSASAGGGNGGGLDLRSGASGSRQLTHHVAAWTYAADAAKLATFEAVAEQLERGQDALEQASQTLDEVDLLLGREKQPGDGQQGSGEDGDDDRDGKLKRMSKHGRQAAELQQRTGDVWEALHGELGLIRAEKTSR